MLASNYRNDLNEVLRLIAEKLDLDETRHKNAEDKYRAVAEWLGASGSALENYFPAIYPQGSFALGTVVKPLFADEYDLDLVCELKGFSGTPEEIKQIVGDRLKENKLYQPPRLEEMNRCWWLNYAGDFHLDILPAKPSTSVTLSETAIQVPDKDLHEWSDSDPKGYVAWFQTQMVEQFNLRKQLLIEQKSIDEVPDYAVTTTLQQAIQLIKRNRDIEFEQDGDDKPISIIITTLAAHVYSNQVDLFDTLFELVSNMPDRIEIWDGVSWVMNPVNHNENFAEKWQKHPQLQAKFLKWLEQLRDALIKMQDYENLTGAEDLLVALFGERITETVLEEMTEKKKLTEPATVKAPPLVNIQGNKPWGVDK